MARATFEDIEHIVWDEMETSNLNPLERVACNELRNLVNKFKKGQVSREQATESKARIKEKYEVCLKHAAMLDSIEVFIYKTEWDFRYTAEFVEQLIDNMSKVAESFKDSELYSNFVVSVVEFYEKRLNEKYPGGFLPSEKGERDAPF